MVFSLLPVTPAETTAPDWIWTNRVARGTLTILEGDPGTNKSTIVYDLAARVSAGLLMPDGSTPSPAGDVWLVSAEDSASRTRATLMACGANLERIKIIQCSGGPGFRLPTDFAEFRSAVELNPPVLVTLDPLSECIEGATTSERSVRAALSPLCQLAAEFRFGVLGLRHLTKSQSPNALYRGGGSIGLMALARSSLLVLEDPFQAGHRVVAQVKSSLGPLSSVIAFKPVENGHGLRIDWLGPKDYSMDQLVAAQRRTEAVALEEACYVLYSLLGDGPLPAKDAVALGHKSGISGRTLRRAKSLLKIQSIRRGFGRGSQFYWELPSRNDLVSHLRDRDLDALMEKLLHGADEFPGERPPKEPGNIRPQSKSEEESPPWSWSDHKDEWFDNDDTDDYSSFER